MSSTELTAAWRQQIFEHHQASQRADKEFAQAILTKIEAVRQTGQLIRECRGELDRQQFEAATDFLTDNAIREYVRFARREPITDLDTAVHVIKRVLRTTGALDFPSGLGPQISHDPPPFFSWVSSMVMQFKLHYSKFISLRPLDSWTEHEAENFAYSLQPILKIHQQIIKWTTRK